jgi:thiamine-phosphate pyrophosphorylase
VIADLPRLHAVTDDRVIAAGTLHTAVERLVAVAGASLAVHVRSRERSGASVFALARELAAVLTPRGAWLAVNDRADVARAAGARLVATGRGGLGVADVRRVAPGAAVARAVHDAAEIRAAAADGADVLVAGHVHATPTHPDIPPRGLDLVREAATTGRAVIAIGGMTPERTAEAVAAGAWGVAAIRALWDAPDPGEAAAAFLAALPAADEIGVVINGEPRRARRGISLADLVTDLGLDPRAVVVEHNRRIVRRDALGATPVAEGDAIELVHFVGGG